MDNGSFVRVFFGATGRKPVLFAQSDSIDNKSTEDEVTSKDNGLDYESIITKRQSTIKGSANLALLSSSTTRTTYAQVRAWWKSGEEVPFTYGLMADENATTFITGSAKVAGNCRITSVSITADDKKKGTFSWDAAIQGEQIDSTVV